MLKRHLTTLIGIGLLGAGVNLAAAQSAFPPSTEDVLYRMLPAQEQYFMQRQAANPNLYGATIPARISSGVPGGPLPATLKFLGERAAKVQAESANARTVKATGAANYLNVAHEETVIIQNDRGQSFVWKADTLGEADLALQAIAPKDFAAGQTRVFVRHPAAHTSGS